MCRTRAAAAHIGAIVVAAAAMHDGAFQRSLLQERLMSSLRQLQLLQYFIELKLII